MLGNDGSLMMHFLNFFVVIVFVVVGGSDWIDRSFLLRGREVEVVRRHVSILRLVAYKWDLGSMHIVFLCANGACRRGLS